MSAAGDGLTEPLLNVFESYIVLLPFTQAAE